MENAHDLQSGRYLATGVVPVLIDPGISKRALKQCLDEAAPEAEDGARRLFMNRPDLTEEQMHDVTWIGSRFFVDTPHPVGGHRRWMRIEPPLAGAAFLVLPGDAEVVEAARALAG